MGCTKRLSKPVKEKVPLTPHKLGVMLNHLPLFPNNITRLALKAALTFAVWGLLRVSEYTSAQVYVANPVSEIQRKNIILHYQGHSTTPSHFSALIKSSKTDTFKKSTTIRIWASDNMTLCPVSAMNNYLRATQWYSPDAPLFHIANNKHLTPNFINKAITTLAQASGFNEHLTSHCARVGGASSLSALGFSEPEIQSVGRWKSNAFRTYTKLASVTEKATSTAFGKMLDLNTTIAHQAANRNYQPHCLGNSHKDY